MSGELKAQALKNALAEEARRMETLKQKRNTLLRECPELAHPEKIEEQLTNEKKKVQNDVDSFHFKKISNSELYCKKSKNLLFFLCIMLN